MQLSVTMATAVPSCACGGWSAVTEGLIISFRLKQYTLYSVCIHRNIKSKVAPSSIIGRIKSSPGGCMWGCIGLHCFQFLGLEFACSSRVWGCFPLGALAFSHKSKDVQVWCTGVSKLSVVVILSMNACLSLCVSPMMSCWLIQCPTSLKGPLKPLPLKRIILKRSSQKITSNVLHSCYFCNFWIKTN